MTHKNCFSAKILFTQKSYTNISLIIVFYATFICNTFVLTGGSLKRGMDEKYARRLPHYRKMTEV